jgi:hypothetical protein
MPTHDWTKADRATFHAFRERWLAELARTLNGGLLPQELTAIVEPDASGLGVRHIKGAHDLARIEIISPALKADAAALDSFVQQTCERLARRMHLLLIDVLPPGSYDPTGVHGLIWNKLYGERFDLYILRPLILVSYEVDATARHYLRTIAVGDPLPDMPLFLAPRSCFEIPLETTSEAAVAKLNLSRRG